MPRQLVMGGDGDTHVWIADRETKTAQRRFVKLGRAGTEKLVEVVSGLIPTDKLISNGREGIVDGERIRVSEEDATLGTADDSFQPSAPSARTARSKTQSQTN